ncbi:DNA replication/repair protein RecF [Rickettsia endosymbiont of Cardiosporidium cionae]|uniref:DNA replication/repair protein RecF n=1 Tax=Rickettsia endosymbiont of Cardiosporidium cionae TaxID=2777155 RepID=UPI001893CB96|nr:AAA family ATPase [Rickettsia endosymbiont of Cardiosporidium cionae]KAF8818310.1 DNA replication/repair protein RecF [Rickettsia endosymbiont of Cardiosporidium cionae]
MKKKGIYIKYLNIINYRNFKNFAINIESGLKPVILTGNNGIGKTNILESISLLAPGKGLRKTKLTDFCKFGEHSWKTIHILEGKLGTSEIINTASLGSNTRNITYNGTQITNLELTKLVNVIWITPQMNTLFIEAPNTRRKLLDRIVNNFDIFHVNKLVHYEYYMKQRMSILRKEGNHNYTHNNKILDTIEEKMSSYAKSIQLSRNNVINLIQLAFDKMDFDFPKMSFLINDLSRDITKNTNGDYIDKFIQNLKNYRYKDALSNRTNFGVHRIDFTVLNKNTSATANLCSTGEQKIMLLSTILSAVQALMTNKNCFPILLLDEFFIHLDSRYRECLYNYLLGNGLQNFITSNSLEAIQTIAKHSEIIKL